MPVVVVGAGALAVAVFRGLAEQLRAAAVHTEEDLRWAAAPEVFDAVGASSADPAPSARSASTRPASSLSVHALPSGTSVAVRTGRSRSVATTTTEIAVLDPLDKATNTTPVQGRHA